MSRSFSTDQHQTNQSTRPVMHARRTRSLAEIEAGSSSVAPVAVLNSLTTTQLQSLTEFPVLGSCDGSANMSNSCWGCPLATSSFAEVLDEYVESDDEVIESVIVPNIPAYRTNAVAVSFRDYRKVLPDPRWSRDRLPVCERTPEVWSKSLAPKVYKLSKRRKAWFDEHGYVPNSDMGDNELEEKKFQQFGQVVDDDEIGPVGKTQWGDACTATEEDKRVRYKNSHEEITPMGKFQFGTA